MGRHRIGIIIPAYNEENTICKIIENAKDYGEIILVNDASDDNTLELVREHKIYIINNEKNLGYEESLSKGFEFASKNKFDFVITFDADGQHQSKYLKIIISHFYNGYDLVIGKRNEKNRIAEKIFSLFGKLFYNISDPCCGLKGYSIKIYNRQGFFSNFNSIGTQLSFFAKKNNFNIKEINITVKKREDVSRFGNIIKSNLIILYAVLQSFFR